jgi:phosphomannomutase
MRNIVFGTEGWRGQIAREFTFENIEIISYATVEYYLKHENIGNGFVVGYDARFLSKEFAETVSAILANRGIKVFLSDSIVSTPMLSLGIVKLKAVAGLMITASHNPYSYNGFKIKSSYGGPATREEVTGVEYYLDSVYNNYTRLKQQYLFTFESLVDKKVISYIDLKKIYKEYISEKFDISEINNSNLKILYDPMYGSGQGFFKGFINNFEEIHGSYNPSFNGINPEPLLVNCKDTVEHVVSNRFDFCIVNDGDADRIAAIDDKGNFISTQLLFPIFLKYLVEEKGEQGAVVKTVSVTDYVYQICKKNNVPCLETPVGFKYITEYMVSQNILIGGEESGGIGLNMHLPERDGIFNGLLLTKIMIKKNKSLSELVNEIKLEFGDLYYDRFDYKTTLENKEKILLACNNIPTFIGDYKVLNVKRIDGFKFLFNDAWLLVRASGTEPLLRFYFESKKQGKIDKLVDALIKLQ